LNGTTGLTGVTGDGTSTVSFSGTSADINTALNGLSYAPTGNYNGSDTLTITTNDNGHTGSGGALQDQDTVAITINAVNDAPVFSGLDGIPTPSFTEGGAAVVLDSNATVSDVELAASGNYAGASLTLARSGG